MEPVSEWVGLPVHMYCPTQPQLGRLTNSLVCSPQIGLEGVRVQGPPNWLSPG